MLGSYLIKTKQILRADFAFSQQKAAFIRRGSYCLAAVLRSELDMHRKLSFNPYISSVSLLYGMAATIDSSVKYSPDSRTLS